MTKNEETAATTPQPPPPIDTSSTSSLPPPSLIPEQSQAIKNYMRFLLGNKTTSLVTTLPGASLTPHTANTSAPQPPPTNLVPELSEATKNFITSLATDAQNGSGGIHIHLNINNKINSSYSNFKRGIFNLFL